MNGFSQVPEPGNYRAFPVSWALQPPTQKGSIGVLVVYEVVEQYQGEDWVNIENHEFAAIRISSYIYPIGQAGKVNQTGVDQLVQSFGWNGSVDQFAQEPPAVLVQLDIKEETYNGKTELKVKWVSPGDRPVVKQATSEDVKHMKAAHGSLLRAAAGEAKKGGKPMMRTATAAASTAPAQSGKRSGRKLEDPTAPPPDDFPPPDQDVPF